MTAIEILKLYDVKMERLQIDLPFKNQKQIITNFTGGNQMEPFFGISYNTIDSIEKDIIKKVDHFINGNSPPMNEMDVQISAIDNYAILYADGVHFYNPNNGNVLQKVPLEHFKIIAALWRDFLLQPTSESTNSK